MHNECETTSLGLEINKLDINPLSTTYSQHATLVLGITLANVDQF